jgi:predicted methyltransferase
MKLIPKPLPALIALLAALSIGAAAGAADRYAAAVAHPGRSAADLKRDALDHPAELLHLAGIRHGMQVADMLAGDGYFSELLSYVVGPDGHVLMINNSSFDKWSDGDRQQRLANHRLPNVEYQLVDLDHMNLAANSLDAIVLSKVYHDLYWVDTTGIWPKFDTSGVLDQLVRALKPGGVLLLIDHSAKVGHGSADASSLHRIEEAYARQDFGKRGMRVVGTSKLLRRADDPREQISYKEPMIGKTDRFVLVLRKQPPRR